MEPIAAGDIAALERRMVDLQAQVGHLMQAVESARRLGSLGVLAATVAHELNNILTPVGGYAQSALARPDDRELCSRALERAADGARRGAELARSILALAGETADPSAARGGEGEGRKADVADAVAEAIDLARFALDGAGVSVETAGAEGVRVAASGGALVQVLQNLLLNASGAMRGRGGWVRVSWRVGLETTGGGPGSGAGEVVEIEVRDNGPGIPGHVCERLFRPFATAGMGRARGGGRDVGPGGSGLGLSICKGLVEAVGGRIEVESVVGEGTTFRVALPRATS